MTVLGAVEEVDERAHDREDGALLRAIFLGEPLARRRDGAAHPVGGGVESCERVEMGEACGDRREEHATAVVERVDREVALPCDELQRRVDEANVPPRVPPWVLVARGEEDPAVLVERGEDRIDRARDGHGRGLPAYRDAAARAVLEDLPLRPCDQRHGTRLQEIERPRPILGTRARGATRSRPAVAGGPSASAITERPLVTVGCRAPLTRSPASGRRLAGPIPAVSPSRALTWPRFSSRLRPRYSLPLERRSPNARIPDTPPQVDSRGRR